MLDDAAEMTIVDRSSAASAYTPGTAGRELFTSRFATLITMIGAALGLGNVWRFPYMVGRFGGAAFVLVYVLIAVGIGVPALMAEWALGRHTRRGPVGAFAAAGLPLGRIVGWVFFGTVTAATAYYTAVIGWVLYYWIAAGAAVVGASLDANAILPPDAGFSPVSFALQLGCTAAVIVACAVVVQKGLRGGIEVASKIIMPVLCAILIILTIRSLTLPGAMEGVRWYLLKFRLEDIDARVMMAALGQAIFSLSLGGTFMVAYGSYLTRDEPLASAAIWTTAGDTVTGLIAGLAIIPAVFALGMEPTAGPALIFSTLPQVFDALPIGWLFGFLFYATLFGAGYLSDIAAVETLTVGLTDNTRLTRQRAVWLISGAVFLLSIPPSINMAIFGTWDLTFGSGMQTLGSLLAVVAFGWCMHRSAALAELIAAGERPVPMWVFYWIRFGIPAAILAVGVWWVVTSVFGIGSASVA